MRGPRDIVPLPPESPWSGFAAPDIQHCEANLAGWIAAPANTWSNLAYLAAAVWLWRRGQRWFAGAAAALGVTSFLFHASFTFFFQFFDYVGMFVYVLLLLALNVNRLGLRRWQPAYLGAVLASGAAVFGLRALGVGLQWIIVTQVGAVLATELAARGRGYKDWLIGIGLMAAAAACWVLDYKRIWCDPDDHWVQGHAAWHLLSAAAIPFVARFYRNNSVTA